MGRESKRKQSNQEEGKEIITCIFSFGCCYYCESLSLSLSLSSFQEYGEEERKIGGGHREKYQRSRKRIKRMVEQEQFKSFQDRERRTNREKREEKRHLTSNLLP